MKLQPISHKVISIDFKPEVNKNNDNFLNIDYEIIFNKNKEKSFNIVFHVKISKKNQYSINISYGTVFISSEPIDNDFLNGNFAKINAPAIAFPFLRSFVSFLILNAGYSPLILNSVNFTSYNKDDINVTIVA